MKKPGTPRPPRKKRDPLSLQRRLFEAVSPPRDFAITIFEEHDNDNFRKPRRHGPREK